MENSEITKKISLQCDEFISVLRDMLELSDEIKHSWDSDSAKIFNDLFTETVIFSVRAAQKTKDHLSERTDEDAAEYKEKSLDDGFSL